MSTDLHDMSEAQLASLLENAQKALRQKQEGKRKEIITQIRELATSIGVTVEISDGAKSVSTRKGSKVEPKYRNPNNHDETWTGRGMKPRWMQALIDQGHDPLEFSI